MLLGEVDDDNAFAMGGVAGHAGLFSTVDDVARFGEAIRRIHAGERIGSIRPCTVRTFLTRDAETVGSTRALGFDTPSPGGASAAGTLMDRRRTFGHLGFTGCSLWLDLSRSLTVALLTNRIHGDYEHDDKLLGISERPTAKREDRECGTPGGHLDSTCQLPINGEDAALLDQRLIQSTGRSTGIKALRAELHDLAVSTTGG